MKQSGLDKERLVEYYRGKYSDTEKGWVEGVFCDSDKEKQLKSFLSGQFDDLLNSGEPEEKNLDHILYKIHYGINTGKEAEKTSKFTGLTKWVLRIAGIVILPFMVYWGVTGYFTARARQQAWVEIKAPAWTRAQFSLPDGTSGWLNSNSSIRYNLDFVNDRQITLHGEAYFDVFKDSKRPFRVIADEVVLNVTGTRFNVSSYENEPSVEVVLEEGSLAFSDTKMTNSYTMRPNDMVTYDKSLRRITTEVVQPQKYLSWKEGKLIFRNDPLDVICRRLGRWYNVDVEVNVGSVENLRLRATFVDENLEEVLDLLKRSLQLNYKIQNGRLNSDNNYSKKKIIILPENS